MNTQVKRLFTIVILMFFSLLLATSYIQYLGADSLNKNPYNNRSFLRDKYRQRGNILVGDQVLAKSEADPQASGTRKQYHRVYAENATLYSHILGYIDSKGNSQGIEKTENSVLMGESAAQLGSRLQEELGGKTHRGGAVRLTIDPALQVAAANALGERRGAVIALNYQTGAILAAVSYPNYDPAKMASEGEKYRKQLQADKPNNPLLNRAFLGEYAPGSAFKVIVAAAAIKEGLIRPESTVEAPVSIRLPGTTARIANIDNSRCGNGHPTFTYAFAKSCNTPFASLGMDLGYQRLKAQADAFGFNPKEPWFVPLTTRKSVFPSRQAEQDPGKPSLAQASIGQYEVRTNPLLMASVAASVANGGTQFKPFLVAQQLSPDGKVVRDYSKGELHGTPITPQIAKQLQNMMQTVIKEGTGQPAAVPGVEMGGKTGTAEAPQRRTNAWFIGYAKTAKYPLAMAVIVEGSEADPHPHGGPVAGPIARKLIEVAQRHD